MTVKERGFVRQKCSACGFRNDSSTICREHAETYDPRCPRCHSDDTMRMVEWVPLSTPKYPPDTEYE